VDTGRIPNRKKGGTHTVKQQGERIMADNSQLQLRIRNQIIQNELSNILEMTIRIARPDTPKIYFDYHRKKAIESEGKEDSPYTMEDSSYTIDFESYGYFIKWLKGWDFGKKEGKEYAEGFAGGKVVPRERFWHTYFSRQPLYLKQISKPAFSGRKGQIILSALCGEENR